MQRYTNEGKDISSVQKKEEGQVVSPNQVLITGLNTVVDKDKDKAGEIFIRNLPYKTTNEECKKFFEQFGKIKNVNILLRDGKSRGVGFVTFEEAKDAIALIESKKELTLEGRVLNVGPSKKQEGETQTNTIFVGNLSYKATEKEIEAFFADCGKVVSVRIAMEHEGRSKGFCYDDFENQEAVKKAVDMKNGKLFDEREIRVDRAQPKREGFYGGRGYGRGRGRGGFRGSGRGFRGQGRGYGRDHGGDDYDDRREYRGRGFGGRGRGGYDNDYRRDYRGGRGERGHGRGRGHIIR